MTKVSIIGFGRFGRTLLDLLKLSDYQVSIYAHTPEQLELIRAEVGSFAEVTSDLNIVYLSHVIFYCVPISKFREVIKAHREYFREQLLIDVLSVKIHPQEVFSTELQGTNCRAILTHPMFGPDSSRGGFLGLPMVMHNHNAGSEEYSTWKQFYAKAGLKVIEITPDEHDRLAASSQGVAHVIGRTLKEFGFQPTIIDSLGAKKLDEVMTQTCSDTWELFTDLQNYNPYTKVMFASLLEAFNKISVKLDSTQ